MLGLFVGYRKLKGLKKKYLKISKEKERTKIVWDQLNKPREDRRRGGKEMDEKGKGWEKKEK